MRAVCFVIVLACACASTGNMTPCSGGDVCVAPGDPVAVDAAGIRIAPGALHVELVNVPEDSRCAIGVQCVWAGRARVRLRVDSASERRVLDLRTDSTTATVFAHTITLDSLLPYPRANQPIEQSQYRAWIHITPN